MADAIEPAEPAVEVEETEEEVETSQPTDDLETLKSRLSKLEEKAIQSRERNRLLRQELSKLRGQSTKDTKVETKVQEPEEFGLLHKSFLRAAGITAEDEVELARTTAKKWGMEIDKLVDDDDFQAKLEKLRTAKANAAATSNVRGGQGSSQAKLSPDHWVAKGQPPTAADVPNRKDRAKIIRAMMAGNNGGKKFYND